MVKFQLYERACVNVYANSREELFKAGRAKLDKLFGNGSYTITEVHYTVDGEFTTGTVYAVYLGKGV